MNKTITLNQETIERFKKLYIEIDRELNKPCNECNVDIVTENQYEILNTFQEILFEEDREYDF